SGFFPAAGPAPGRNPLQGPLLGVLLVLQVIALVFPQLAAEPWWAVVDVSITVYVVGGLFYAVMRLWRAARAAEGTAAGPRLQYLFYAGLIALGLSQPGIPVIGPIATAVYLYFMAQTLTRERLLDLPEILGRIASMTLLVVTVTAVYAALVLWVPFTFSGEPMLLVFNTLLASFAVLVLIDPLRNELDRRLESWLFRDRSILRALLDALRRRLVNLIDPDEMVRVVMDTLRGSERVTRASIYLLDRQGSALRLRGHVGVTTPPASLDLATRRPLLERMRQHGPLLRDVLERQRERAPSELKAELDECLATLAEVGASLAVPIRGLPEGGAPEGTPRLRLLGVLFVDDERLLEPFSREEVELFEGVVAQAAVMIENSTVYEQRKERDRLAALGEMAAGLAHEIRNPLGAIKGAVQVVEPNLREADPVTREFLGVIVEEVERLNRVVTQFLTYSRPFTGQMGPVAMGDVVVSTLRLLDEDCRARVTVTQAANLPPVRGDAEALRQVLLNLLRNAFDALAGAGGPAGRVWVSLGLRRHGLASGDAVTVTVRDNGPGFAPGALANLFVPFHTTKTSGTGLGLPISQRIVENHRGLIEVSAPEGGGAQFTVVLPVFAQPRAESPA
ncbi:MAG TPA: ATP-binding protein, partial [Nannocystis sp.]